jgi:outer membrane protein assembly factor BamB
MQVLTRSYDNARTGANIQESVLTPTKVQSGLKILFSLHIPDDQRLEAQPLYVPGITMSDSQIHDVVYICSMGNTIWAFDANTGAAIWPSPVVLGTPIKGSTDIDSHLINDHWGILSTPVIDSDTQTMYVVNWSLENNQPLHRLHAIDITSGQQIREPLLLEATSPLNVNAVFKSPKQKQRSALLLAPLRQPAGPPVKKTLFVACGMTHETAKDTHGWVIAFDVASFRQTAAWCSTPNSSGGGIWQAGQGPAADEQGNIYVMTSNGGWNGTTDFAESFVKLQYTSPNGQTPGALTLVDWFTPFRDSDRKKPTGGYDFQDQDLGSGGPVVLPGSGILLGAGKDGVLYVLNKDNLGRSLADFAKLKQLPIFFTYSPAPDKSPIGNLDFNFLGKTHHLHGTPVFWNSPDQGQMLFVWGENDNLRAWNIDAEGKTTFLAHGNETASAGLGGLGGMPGGILTLSADGQTPGSGIVWATAPISGDANKHVVEGILRAYDAQNFITNPDGSKTIKLLWDSKQIPGNTFKHDKFCPPVVADGKVFVPTYEGRVDVYAPP